MPKKTSYILPEEACENLKKLQEAYESKKGISLSPMQHSIFSLPKYLGGVDTTNRRQQIHFIQKMLSVIEENLIPIMEIKTSEQWCVNHTAQKLLIACCIFVRNDIKKAYSQASPLSHKKVLYNIIDEFLLINQQNELDNETIETCCLSARRFINKKGFDEANAKLMQKNREGFTEQEWKRFSDFIDTYVDEKKAEDEFKSWPFTSIAKPLFGYTAGAAGAAVGVVIGEVLGSAMPFLSEKKSIASAISSGIVLCGISSTYGPMLVAPIIASKLFDTFLQIFFARSLYACTEMLGQAAGTIIGMPLDIAYHSFNHACTQISELRNGYQALQISGTRIIDGSPVYSGMVFDLEFLKKEEASDADLMKKQYIEAEDIGNHRIKVGETIIDLKQHMPAVIEELKHKIKNERFEELQEEKPLIDESEAQSSSCAM